MGSCNTSTEYFPKIFHRREHEGNRAAIVGVAGHLVYILLIMLVTSTFDFEAVTMGSCNTSTEYISKVFHMRELEGNIYLVFVPKE